MIYFMADSHLGSLLHDNPAEVTGRVCRWLDHVSADATAIYLLGDIFDFWYEFAHAVPPGFDSLLDTIAGITARGIEVHFFPGNHDQWTFGYLARRTGMTVHHSTEELTVDNQQFLLAHGHGLGEQRRGTRILNSIFENRYLRWLFRHLIVPRWGIAFGYRWSAHNRRRHDKRNTASPDKAIDYYSNHNTDTDAYQVQWAKQYTASHPHTRYIVMGHLHREINMILPSGAQLLILNAFYIDGSYACFDGKNLYLG